MHLEAPSSGRVGGGGDPPRVGGGGNKTKKPKTKQHPTNNPTPPKPKTKKNKTPNKKKKNQKTHTKQTKTSKKTTNKTKQNTPPPPTPPTNPLGGWGFFCVLVSFSNPPSVSYDTPQFFLNSPLLQAAWFPLSKPPSLSIVPFPNQRLFGRLPAEA